MTPSIRSRPIRSAQEAADAAERARQLVAQRVSASRAALRRNDLPGAWVELQAGLELAANDPDLLAVRSDIQAVEQQRFREQEEREARQRAEEETRRRNEAARQAEESNRREEEARRSGAEEEARQAEPSAVPADTTNPGDEFTVRLSADAIAKALAAAEALRLQRSQSADRRSLDNNLWSRLRGSLT